MIQGLKKQSNEINMPHKPRKPGRPRTIPPELEPSVAEIYHHGYGYRATARILREEFGINPDYTTVRRTLKRLGIIALMVK